MPTKLLCLLSLLLAPMAGLASPVVLVLGDSLSAAYGINRNEGWVSMMQRRLQDKSFDYRVVNASISGETTSGALARLDREIEQHRPDVVIVELGGNDGLRGQSPERIETNLGAIIDRIRAGGAEVLLAGMQLPPNYGRAYTQAFARAYQRLADEKKVALVPFILSGIANDRTYFQPDGIHPTAAAQRIILDTVWPKLEPMLKRQR